MLARCANPKCNAHLKYMHEGRVFPISTRKSIISLRPRIEYRWLCSSCSEFMTIGDDGRIPFVSAVGIGQRQVLARRTC